MISVANMFITESVYSETKEALSKYFNMPAVKNFIDLSKKVVQDGVESLSEKEQKTYRGLFEDPAVRDYISAARRAGERDGWIRGGILGGISGGAMGSVLGGGIAAANDFGPTGVVTSFIILGLLGAAAGGAISGWTWSNALSWLRKWRAEDDVVALGRVGGKIGQTTPIIKADL
ncbi:MAG TPA: hypothetical protein PLL26_06735 [Candidatus Dojkabacteria bacterium]|nr:hypothetical protein [Candidatus Dojkabacteria bacterium]